MIVQHKITLEIKEKLTSSAIAYPLYAWLLSHVSKETGDALHEQGLRPISQYVYREGEHIRWVVNLLNDEAAELFGPILERESAALIHQGVIPFGEHRTETIESAQCLLGRARNMDDGNRFALDMVTPTAFKQSGRYAIFPQESLMLQSLIARWGLCFPEFPLDDPGRDAGDTRGAACRGLQTAYRALYDEADEDTVFYGARHIGRASARPADGNRQNAVCVCAVCRYGNQDGAGYGRRAAV